MVDCSNHTAWVARLWLVVAVVVVAMVVVTVLAVVIGVVEVVSVFGHVHGCCVVHDVDTVDAISSQRLRHALLLKYNVLSREVITAGSLL